MLAIALSVGARSVLFTVIVSVLLSVSDPSLAVTVAPYVPESVKPGARWMLPDVALVVVTVMNAGPAAFVNVRVFAASASVAFAVIVVSAVPSVPLAVAGAVIAGCWFTLFTVIVSVLLFVSDPSLAVTVAPYVPESVKPGARWMLPDVALVVVTVMNAGPAAFVNVRASPSGSVPVTT